MMDCSYYRIEVASRYVKFITVTNSPALIFITRLTEQAYIAQNPSILSYLLKVNDPTKLIKLIKAVTELSYFF